jgi:2-polyprenyl-6-methoxyphenol hydroxylase-like FAD-dependent oxidoreductase
MSDLQQVLVVGAGIGGLAAGTALGQRDIEVDIVELKDENVVYGVGLNQPANALRAIKTLGVLDECLAVGFQWDRAHFCDHAGNLVVEVQSKLGNLEPGLPANNGLPRTEFHRILTTAAEKAGALIRLGTTVEALQQHPDHVEVTFTDGTRGSYDLVVGFDGIRSQLRRTLFGESHDPGYTGAAVWRVTVPKPPEITHMYLWQGSRAKAGLLPITESSMYLLNVTLEPGRPRQQPEQFHELLRERLEEFTVDIVAEIREGLTTPDGIVYSPIEEVDLPPPWYQGRVLIAGDAAHASAPHITQGASMAIEDAVVLAELAVNGDPVLQKLATFMERRYPRCKFVQDVSHQILEAEMNTDPEFVAQRNAHAAEMLPAQLGAVDDFLAQPI